MRPLSRPFPTPVNDLLRSTPDPKHPVSSRSPDPVPSGVTWKVVKLPTQVEVGQEELVPGLLDRLQGEGLLQEFPLQEGEIVTHRVPEPDVKTGGPFTVPGTRLDVLPEEREVSYSVLPSARCVLSFPRLPPCLSVCSSKVTVCSPVSGSTSRGTTSRSLSVRLSPVLTLS